MIRLIQALERLNKTSLRYGGEKMKKNRKRNLRHKKKSRSKKATLWTLPFIIVLLQIAKPILEMANILMQ
ncbi:MAG: hypothetical protein ACRC68_10145 [Clostridium sp.]